jgi:DNA topoisomerase IA
MKLILVAILALSSLLLANDIEKERKIRTEKHIKKVMEDEAKYAREQAFYTADDYDFEGSEVNEESLEVIKVPEVDDLDMDHVYD